PRRPRDPGAVEGPAPPPPRGGGVRFLAATNAAPRAEVAAGRFRQDLLFRLNTIEVRVPPLRERREDIPPLAEHFLGIHSRRYKKSVSTFERASFQALMDHSWPGNVRELDHAIERAVLLPSGASIRPAELGLRREPEAGSHLEEMSLEQVEGILVQKAMARFGGNVSEAARALGLSRSALYRRLEKYGV